MILLLMSLLTFPSFLPHKLFIVFFSCQSFCPEGSFQIYSQQNDLSSLFSFLSSFLKEIEKCENAPEKLASVFLKAVSQWTTQDTIDGLELSEMFTISIRSITIVNLYGAKIIIQR